MFIRRLLFILLFIFLSVVSEAQRKNYSYYFSDYRKKSLTVPFEFVNNVIIIPVSINGSDTLKFILDSGVKTPIITNLPTKDSVRFKFIQIENIHGLGDGKPVEAYYTPSNIFLINGLKRKHINALVLENDVFGLSNEIGTEINGLIGYDLFKDIIVEIDYYRKKIIFHDPKYYEYRRNKNAVSIPLQVIKSKPFINAQVTFNEENVLDANLLIDTGASLSLWLSKESDDKIEYPEKTFYDFIGKGLNGDIYGKKGKVQSLTIGTYNIESPITAFPDSSSVLKTVIQEHRHGSIGQEILRRFTVIFNYQENLITFIPNPYFKDRFKYNLSGITLTSDYPGLPIYSISKIRKNSPACVAGLKEGDQILYINSLNASDLTLGDLNYFLQSKQGRTIRLTVFRDGKRIKYKFKLKDEL